MLDSPEIAVMRACGRNSPMNIDRTPENAGAIGLCCANGWLEEAQFATGAGNYVPTDQGRKVIYELYGIHEAG